MGINPNILLTGRGPEVVDPMETAARGMSLANAARQSHVEDLKLKEYERQRQADEQIRGIFSQGINDPEELVRRVSQVDPARGGALATQFADMAKKRADALKVTTDVDKTRDEILNSKRQAVGNRAAALLQTPAEARAALYGQMRGELLQGGQFKPEELPEQVPDDLTLKYLSGATLSPKEQQELSLKLEQDKRAAEQHKAQLPGMTADARTKELAAAGQSVAAVTDQATYDAWLATQPESVRTYWGPGFSPDKVKQIQRVGMTAAQRTTADQTAVTSAETARHNRESEKAARQRNAIALDDNAIQRARLSADKGGRDTGALIDAVMQNPEMWDGLTPTARTAIAPDLAKRGFTGFGKRLSDAALKDLTASRSAINSLRELRELVTGNEQYIGPISGLQNLNPWSDARKINADIARVRQRVGKALEGGVLRKEDEEKYKNILATLSDKPETATYKIDGLIQEIERDMNTYVEELRAAGRRVPELNRSGGGAPNINPPNAPTVVKPTTGTTGLESVSTDELLRRLANAGKSK